jgi:hyperosmotically inducible periplasmic protein
MLCNAKGAFIYLSNIHSFTKINFMRKSFLRFAFVFTAIAFITLSMSSCKSGPKDADIEKTISEKAAAVSSDATGVSGTVKDGVATLSGTFKDDASKEAFETTVKAIPGVQSVVNNSTVTPPAPVVTAAPVINGDDALTKGVTDATKDFPTVKASVKDSVITLTGDIKKASLPKLMMTLHSLKPKKIDNQLTTK